MVARDNGHGLPCVRAFCAARLPDLSVEMDLAIGAAGGCDGRGLPDQGLNAHAHAAVPISDLPEGQFAEEDRNARGETDEILRRRKKQEKNEPDDEEHRGRA